MKKDQAFMLLFLAAAIGDLASIYLDFKAQYLFKTALVPALVGYYLSSAKSRNPVFIRALFFCWVGDFMLMFADKDQWYFIIGLVAFLIGHLFYIFSFRQLVWEAEGNMLPTQRVRYIFPILLAGTGLVVILYPKLGDLKLPVMLYSIVLMLMVSYALFRMGRTSKESFTWLFIGACLFMLSDSILAINKFHTPIFMGSIWIMITYIAAQFMIVKGALYHSQSSAG